MASGGFDQGGAAPRCARVAVRAASVARAARGRRRRWSRTSSRKCAPTAASSPTRSSPCVGADQRLRVRPGARDDRDARGARFGQCHAVASIRDADSNTSLCCKQRERFGMGQRAAQRHALAQHVGGCDRLPARLCIARLEVEPAGDLQREAVVGRAPRASACSSASTPLASTTLHSIRPSVATVPAVPTLVAAAARRRCPARRTAPADRRAQSARTGRA